MSTSCCRVWWFCQGSLPPNNNRNNDWGFVYSIWPQSIFHILQCIYGQFQTQPVPFIIVLNWMMHLGTGIFLKGSTSNSTNGYGRLNQQFIAPTKYLINLLWCEGMINDGLHLLTAFKCSGAEAYKQAVANSAPWPIITYAAATITLTSAIYPNMVLMRRGRKWKIYPLCWMWMPGRRLHLPHLAVYSPDMAQRGQYRRNWFAGCGQCHVHPYPQLQDEDRFFVYLSNC